MKMKMKKPTKNQLHGVSPSEFKTLLKLRGHKVDREFFKLGCISTYKNRHYRFRFWGTVGDSKDFVVDISCPLSEFDRWSNSVDKTITFEEWLKC